MHKINLHNLLLQNALSSELNAKIVEWRILRDEITQIAAEYEAMTENECFLENDFYRLQMEDLERMFNKKQKEFSNRAGMLRVIFVHPIYVN